MSAMRRKKCFNCGGKGELYHGDKLKLPCRVCHGRGSIERKTKAARKHDEREARATCASS